MVSAEDRETELSVPAQYLDAEYRRRFSNLTGLDLRRGPKNGRGDKKGREKKKRSTDFANWRAGVAYLLLMSAILGAIFVASTRSNSDSSAPTDSSEAAPETQVVIANPPPNASEEPATVEAPEVQAEAAGRLSGDWNMWWTNSLGNQNVGFTIRFNGVDSGSIDVLNDDTDYDTFFELNDDVVWLGFTRVLERTGAEVDFFIGTFAEDGIVYGEWTRVGDGGEDDLVFEAWLVRET